MDLGLKGKVVIVTGGAKGIGGAISEAFAMEGANLVVNYRSNPEKSEAFTDGLKEKYGIDAIAVQGDLSAETDILNIYEKTWEHFGKADILINNAGSALTVPLEETSLEQWNRLLDNNVTGMFLMSREFAKKVVPTERGGRIINILSKVAMSTTSKSRACYVTNKTAELGLTRQLAVDLVDKGIYVNGVLPGLVRTDINKNLPTFPAKEQRTPLKRANEPWELAKVVVFIASEQCRIMVGSMVDCTAGMLLGF